MNMKATQNSRQMPQYLRSAETLAAEQGMSAQDLLDVLRETALSPNYPTPDCFLPNEVWEYERTGAIPDGRLSHADECTSCRALLATLTPDTCLVEEVKAEVAAHRRAAATKSSVSVFPTHKKKLALAAAAAVLCVGAVLAARYLRESDASWTVQLFPLRTSPGAPGSLVLTNKSDRRQISIPVRTYLDGRISKESYPAVAAASALVSLPGFEIEPERATGLRVANLDDSSSELLTRRLVIALASVCTDVDSSSSERTEALKQELSKQNVQVVASNGELTVFDGKNTATLSPEVLSSTLEYCRLLKKHQGSIASLSRSTQGVNVELEASNSQAKVSAVGMKRTKKN